ncbi:hypothetical protein HY523_01115 [Candidatus Berkelbacteria bacterium]|nr:hypothetical protein [Candidatus Berkelbacteria bacterium]
MQLKEIAKVTWLPVVFASLCCLSPVILVLLGLSTVSFAASLADTLYGTYKWSFRALGLILLLVSLGWYFWKAKGICTLDEAKRRRNEIINTVLIVLLSGVIGYVVFLYIIVEYAGILLGIWSGR